MLLFNYDSHNIKPTTLNFLYVKVVKKGIYELRFGNAELKSKIVNQSLRLCGDDYCFSLFLGLGDARSPRKNGQYAQQFISMIRC